MKTLTATQLRLLSEIKDGESQTDELNGHGARALAALVRVGFVTLGEAETYIERVYNARYRYTHSRPAIRQTITLTDAGRAALTAQTA